MRNTIAILLTLVPMLAWGQRQTYYQYSTDEARLVFFDKSLSRYIPHIVRMYDHGKALHEQIWTTDSLYRPEAPLLMITDWEDEGNGGVSPLPHTMIQIGMAPLSKAYNVYPSAERYRHLFDHEYTHVVMTDKYNCRDLSWRRFFGLGKGSRGYGAKGGASREQSGTRSDFAEAQPALGGAKGGVLRGIVYKCVSYDKGCYLLSDGTEPVEGNDNWNAWEVKYPNEYPSYIFNPLQQIMDAPWDSVPDEAYNDLVRQHFYWDNLVDIYLLSIVVGLADAGYKNCYLSCPDYTADQHFVITPWDMDHSFGASYRGVPLMDPSTLKGQTNWINTRPFKRLMANAESGFLTSLADRWAALRDGTLSVESVTQRIYDYANLFDQSGAWQRDRDQWNYNPVTLGETAQDEATYMTEWYQANHDRLDNLLLPYQSDGIRSTVNGQPSTVNAWYDVSGRKVANSKLSKGIYFNGHKKILIK